MFYFVDQYLLSSNSSIEHSIIKRLKLFGRNNVNAKLVTLDFDTILHATLQRFGLKEDQLVNLYDFFAGTTSYQGKPLRSTDLKLSSEYQIGSGSNNCDVTEMDRLVAKIYFIGGTFGQVDHVDYYDQSGNITLRERYDIRGFKAVSQFFGQRGEIHNECYYQPDGNVYLEKFYVQSTQNTPINSLNILKNYKGNEYYFDTPNELITFFLEELDKSSSEQNTFIADRPAISIPTIAAMKNTDAKRYISIPFNHVAPGANPVKGQLNGLIGNALINGSSKWDGVIVDTKQQQLDLQKRLKNNLPVYAINASPVSHSLNKFSINDRLNKQMIYVGRLGEDKGTSELLTIFEKVQKKVPEARLTLFGYGTDDDTKRYKEQVEKSGLSNSVIFAGYVPQLDEIYNGAQLFIDTGVSDAEPLAVGEALGHGVPIVSYNYAYGPNELVKPGINGELVPVKNTSKMAEKIISLLTDTNYLQKLSDGAYDNLDEFDNQATWKQWQALINSK